MVVQEPDQLLVKARQVICLVEEAVATVVAEAEGGVTDAVERIASRRGVSADEARELLEQHAARYGHRVEAVASAVVRFDLDIDDDLGV